MTALAANAVQGFRGAWGDLRWPWLVALLGVPVGLGIGVASMSESSILFLGLLLASVAVLAWPLAGTGSNVLWWMHPGWAMLVGVGPGVVLAYLIPAETFLVEWGAPKFFRPEHGALVLGLTAVFAVAAQAAIRFTQPGPEVRPRAMDPALLERLVKVTKVLFWLTVTGYVLWIGVGVSRGMGPSNLLPVLTGGSVSGLKSNFLRPVAGVTTLTQFGPLTAVCLVLLHRAKADIRVHRYLLALVLLALCRVVFYAERLAMIELVLPLVIIAIRFPVKERKRRALVSLLPLWAPVALLVFFGSFEYLRSWNSHYREATGGNQSYASFTVARVGAYYATAVNNSVLQIREDPRARKVPEQTVKWAWNLPGAGKIADYKQLTGTPDGASFPNTLKSYANPEFSNRQGVLLSVYDVGRPLAVVFWLLCGLVVGWAFALFRASDIRGLLFFPILFTGLLETGLILYWAEGRAFPSQLGAVVVGFLLLRLLRVRQTAEDAGEDEAVAGAGEPPPEPPPAAGRLGRPLPA